ncbi:SMAD/FHA domain-containing protein [Punctularia strigosozonata HHB-11173 SS5]|uniref:SMAD/FHA domain-containing protein n=1 Tax=Punctularia strigosozonata (strain HHB-11173) TaxID=741275 RepID=UPI0004418652|nr:SMAD/FHA domain-containing protein [Punctularia strigosozonata HHB-11173 SS5]EIN12932.1 SMAD/FHA domain-containing protein [Punctularia strigosozonata HHB-11173 SS5]
MPQDNRSSGGYRDSRRNDYDRRDDYNRRDDDDRRDYINSRGYSGRRRRSTSREQDRYFRRRRDEVKDIRRTSGEREPDREHEHDGARYRDARPRERARDVDRTGSSGPSRTNRSASPRRRSRPRSQRSGSRSASPEDKAKPNFGASGLLAAETKKVQHTDGTSTVLKYHEPPEARKPQARWRLYVFKGSEQVELLHIHAQSAYLFGRDRAVVDVPLEHPSSSKQHAVIQYRAINEKNEFGEVKAVVKPFIIDLESTNGTHVNDVQIPAARYYELQLNDVIKFGLSAREYVLLHDDAA